MSSLDRSDEEPDSTDASVPHSRWGVASVPRHPRPIPSSSSDTEERISPQHEQRPSGVSNSRSRQQRRGDAEGEDAWHESPNTRRRAILGPYGLTTDGDEYHQRSRPLRSHSTREERRSERGNVPAAHAAGERRVALHSFDNPFAHVQTGKGGARQRSPTRRRGRGRGQFHPANKTLHNGLPTYVADSGGDVAYHAIYHRENQPGVEAVRAYRAGIALVTGIDPAAARDRARYRSKSSGWRTLSSGEVEGAGNATSDDTAWVSAPVGPQYASVGQRLSVKESPVARPHPMLLLREDSRHPPQQHPRALPSPQPSRSARWVWTCEEKRPTGTPRATTPRHTASDGVNEETAGGEARGREGLSPPDRPSSQTAARLRRSLLHDDPSSMSSSSPPRTGGDSHAVAAVGSHQRDAGAIMEAALAARFGLGAANARPSAISPAAYLRPHRTPPPSQPERWTEVTTATADDLKAEEGKPERRVTAASLLGEDHEVSIVDQRAGAPTGGQEHESSGFLRLRSPATPSFTAELSQQGQRQQRRAEEGMAEEQRRLLLFPPMLTPLLEEVNQCLHEHELGSLLDIWRADRSVLNRVLAAVGFSVREREVILYELARMVRNTSTTCGVAI